jgi:integrase
VPDPDIEELRRFRRVTKCKQKGMTEKNKAMLRLFEDEEYADRLLSQGDKALAEFLKLERPSVRDALALQSALAIELLIAAPVRSQNLCSIEIDRHLTRQQIGKRETYHLVFAAKEVKNDVDMAFKLPPRAAAILKAYITNALPLIARPGSPYLFPGHGLRHKGASFLSKQIARQSARAVGVRVTAHRFRHLAGFLYLKDNPSGHEVVRRFLGHKCLETTIAFYAGMEQSAAIALYDQHIEELRKQLVATRSARTSKRRRRINSLQRKKLDA